jgi:hypothetical protein
MVSAEQLREPDRDPLGIRNLDSVAPSQQRPMVAMIRFEAPAARRWRPFTKRHSITPRRTKARLVLAPSGLTPMPLTAAISMATRPPPTSPSRVTFRLSGGVYGSRFYASTGPYAPTLETHRPRSARSYRHTASSHTKSRLPSCKQTQAMARIKRQLNSRTPCQQRLGQDHQATTQSDCSAS